MPRIRTIKPEFWDSPGTAQASLRARLFFIAMWNWADDYGIGTANPKQLIGFAFPNDDDVSVADFPHLCTEVATCFDIVFYEVSGRPYYAIPSWDEHQKNERRAQGKNPGPDQGKRIYRGTSAQTHGSSGPGTGEQGNRGTGEQDQRASAVAEREPTRDEQLSADFAEWYAQYPRKKSRGQAWKAYKSARSKVDRETLLTGLRAHLPDFQQRPIEKVPHPATWLNGENWDDELASNVHHLPPPGSEVLPDGTVLPPRPKGVFEQ